MYVYISPTSAGTWGPDQLNSTETIAVGASRSWTVPNDTYDIKVSDFMDDYEQYGIVVNSNKTVTFTQTHIK